MCVCAVCVCDVELDVRLMTEHAPLSRDSDVRTLSMLRQTCVIEAINLNSAIHYQLHDCTSCLSLSHITWGGGDESPGIWSDADFVSLQYFKHQIACLTVN